MKKKATIIDVAEMAGVSTSTVSFILNKTKGHSFSPETIARVHDAVEKLQYVRSNSARKLRAQNRSSGLICLAYATTSLRVQTSVLNIIKVLKENGYSVIQTPIHVDVPTHRIQVLDQYFSDSVDGIICHGLAGWSLGDEWSSIIVERRVPFVTVDCNWDRHISSVEIDYLTGAQEMVRSLIQDGAEKLYYLYDSKESGQTIERLRGVRRAIYDAGQEIELIEREDPLLRAPFMQHTIDLDDHGDSFQRIATALEGLDARSAVLLDWADHNQYVLEHCRQLGLDIPIVGMERGTLSPVLYPQLHYSALPLNEMGRLAAEALLRLLKNPEDIVHEMLTPTLFP